MRDRSKALCWLIGASAFVLFFRPGVVAASDAGCPCHGRVVPGGIVGEVRPFLVGEAPSSYDAAELHAGGWLEAEAQSLDIETFRALYQVIGAFAVLPSKGRFRIPDLRRGVPANLDLRTRRRLEDRTRELLGADAVGRPASVLGPATVYYVQRRDDVTRSLLGSDLVESPSWEAAAEAAYLVNYSAWIDDTTRQLLGADLLDTGPAPDRPHLAYYLYVGQDVTRFDPGTGTIGAGSGATSRACC